MYYLCIEPILAPEGVHHIGMSSVVEDRAITVAAERDPDAKPLTARQLKAMVPMKALRGRPKSETIKLLVSVRYSLEVIAYFRSTGEGWQSDMDEVLRKRVRHSQNAAWRLRAMPETTHIAGSTRPADHPSDA